MQETDADAAIAEYTKLIPIIATALRLLGVYIVIVGGSTVIEDLVRIIWIRLEISELSSGTLLDYLFSPSLIGNLAYLLGGLYLLFGGRWLIHKVFMPFTASESDVEDGADPSNA